MNMMPDYDSARHVRLNRVEPPIPVTLGKSRDKYTFPPEPVAKLPAIRRNYNRSTARSRPTARSRSSYRALLHDPDMHVAKKSFSYVDEYGDRQDVIAGVTSVHRKHAVYKQFPENFA